MAIEFPTADDGSGSQAAEPVIRIDITLHRGFSADDGVQAIVVIGQALNRLAGEALVSGIMTAANPVMVSILNAAGQLEQAVMQSAQQRQQALQQSNLALPGMPGSGPRRFQ